MQVTLVEETRGRGNLGDRSSVLERALRAEQTHVKAVCVWRLPENGLELPREMEAVHARGSRQFGESHILGKTVDEQIPRSPQPPIRGRRRRSKARTVHEQAVCDRRELHFNRKPITRTQRSMQRRDRAAAPFAGDRPGCTGQRHIVVERFKELARWHDDQLCRPCRCRSGAAVPLLRVPHAALTGQKGMAITPAPHDERRVVTRTDDELVDR